MNGQSFVAFLNEIHAEPDMLQQAQRIYLAEQTDDRTRTEMTSDLRSAAATPSEVDALLDQLKGEPEALEQMALEYFAVAWEDLNQRPAIRDAFEHAKNVLPVIEITVLSIAAMYGMYLMATGGVTKEKRTVKRAADGTYQEVVDIEREPFAPIVSAVIRIFGARDKTPARDAVN